jgi:2-keto-4-pentenoate hydratase/2-oxohepta-3-ene-1,7-dioic acid hydratase in catechol pathway
MRLVSFRQGDSEQLGLEQLGLERADGRVVATSVLGAGLPRTMSELLAGGEGALEALRTSAAAESSGPALEPEGLGWLAPVPRPGKVIAVGLNYHDHAREGGREAPERPMLFAKFSTSVVGHGANVEWDPALTSAVDLEAELGVVIGGAARRVSEADALDHVLGYTCLNDVSARDLQFSDKQFVRSKSLDTFCPMGPVLVTTDEIPDPGRLAIRSFRNGTIMQDSNTAQLVFGVAELVSFCSQAFTLEPGDVIATGTPAGVGWYRDPKVLMADGDVMTVEIEGIGRLENRCRTVRAA